MLDRRRASASSSEAPELEEVLDALPSATWVVVDGIVTFANRSVAELLGQPTWALAGREFETLVAASDRPGLWARLGEARGEPIRIRLSTDDERDLALDLRARTTARGALVITGEDATAPMRFHAMIGQLSRVYEKRRARRMLDIDVLLEESREVFAALDWRLTLLAVQPDGLVIRYRDPFRGDTSSEAGRFAEEVSDMLLPWHAVPLMSEVVQAGVGVFADDLPVLVEYTAAQLGVADPSVIARGLAADGMNRAAFAPVFADERVAHILVVVGQDLTERDFAAIQLFAAMLSATERANHASVELAREQQSAALGQMSTQLAHEVRNPLAVVLQASRQIRRRYEQRAPIDDLMDMIDEEAHRLERLVNDLVHFAGPLQARLRPTYLEQVVILATDALHNELPSRCDHVTLNVHIDSQLQVEADPLLLRQVVAHLLLDACVHCERGGQVWVSSERESGMVRLRVLNDGEPVPDHLAERVFEPFFTTKAQGSSLGLAVVRRLVDSQGGQVKLDRESDRHGFSVWLRETR